MSIELLPPPAEYPNKHHVRRNRCDCHVETCQCRDPWAIYDGNGKKGQTFYNANDAQREANRLNI